MKSLFKITDYKIRSVKIYRGTLLTFLFVLIALLLAEIFVDLKSTSIEILLPLALINLISIVASYKLPNSLILRSIFPIAVYALMEIHFIISPTIYHVIHYWFPLVAILSLIIQGTRAFQIWIGFILITYILNSLYLGVNIGDSYLITVYKTPFLATFIIYSLCVLTISFLLYTLLGNAYNNMILRTNELEATKQEIEKKKILLENYQRELISLSRDQSIFSTNQDNLFKIICEAASKTLKVTRVSIWLFEEDNTRIVRKFLYESDNSSDDSVVLNKSQFPNYFKAIESQPFILATDARKHPDTNEFTLSYLIPLDIYSMLDCPFVLEKKPIGVICCEHRHEIKRWNVEDALFVQSLSDFISISFKNERINNLLGEVQQKNFELIEKNNEIETMNEELNTLNEELITTNDSLEETVKHRTKELEAQNTQLTEYAFINSHLLRAPLARVLGLSNLLTKEATSIKDSQLLNALLKSTNELDEIIRKISDILYDANNLTREDIKSIIDRKFSDKN